MKRAQRLELVQRATEHAERDRAESLVRAEQEVQACEAKLTELTRYRQDYERALGAPDLPGRDVSRLRDFQVFLARLTEAISQQRVLLTQARARREAQLAHWQQAAQRAKAVGTLADRWQAEDRRSEDRREQNETDERAQRVVSRSAADHAGKDQSGDAS